MNFKVRIWGPFACFSRPETNVEQYTYDVITPSACRNILNAIYYKPEMRWVIDRIHVYNEPNYISMKRNMIGVKGIGNIPSKLDKPILINPNNCRQQLNITMLKDVEYIIEAHIECVETETSTEENTIEKYDNIALRRLQKGQFAKHPYFGCRELPAYFELVDEIPKSNIRDLELGLMLFDVDYENYKPIFYNPVMKNGVIEVPDLLRKEDK